MEDNVRSIERVFDILEQLSAASSPMGISDIAKATGLSKSTVHRILNTMCNRSYANKSEDGTYSLGYKIMEIASTHINILELVTEAKPFLSKMTRELDLTTHLGILDGSEVVYIEQMDGHFNAQLYTQIGHHSPAFCSSMGKCLLSGLSGEELEEVLDSCDFRRYTKNTITDRKALIRHLKQVRRQGWAIDDEEYEEGHRCIGATIFDYRGNPMAAISASGSITEVTDDRIEEIIETVKSVARRLSRQMGYVE